MKVVKCLEHIPKEIRGRVVKDDIHIICANTMYQLKPSDTFPLPQQGDEVEVSENGLFTDFEERKASFMVYYKGVFVTDEGGFYDNWEYIRPIEKEEKIIIPEVNDIYTDFYGSKWVIIATTVSENGSNCDIRHDYFGTSIILRNIAFDDKNFTKTD